MRTLLAPRLADSLRSGCRWLRMSWPLVVLVLNACRERPLFERVSSGDSGIGFVNAITESDSLNVMNFEYLYNGGGVGVGDFNNDGLTDVYFSGNQTPGKLYLNRGGLRFEDVTAASGVLPTAWCTGVSLVDLNADGRLDIFLSTIHPTRGQQAAKLFYLNLGNGADGTPRFREVAAAVGLADRSYGTQAAFFDYDRDGDLDVYLLTNALESFNRNLPIGPVRDGTARSTDRLYRNDVPPVPTAPSSPDSTLPHFTNVTAQEGILLDGWGLGVAVADFNNDGWPDVYCANDFQSNDVLWINQHAGGRHTGFVNCITDYISHQSYNAMGVDVADLNNDGRPELMTLDMMPDDNRRQKSMFGAQNVDRFQLGLDRGYQPQYVRNALQLNQGKDAGGQTRFSEIGQLAGVSATDWSWSTLMADFDNDGFRDIFVTNGYPKDITDLDFMAYSKSAGGEYFRSSAPSDVQTRRQLEALIGVKKPNWLFMNRGTSRGEPPTFADATQAAGIGTPSFSNGAAYADFDNDGDLDLVVNNINDPAFLYRNTTAERAPAGAPTNHYLRVNLLGEGANRAGLGAKVELHYGPPGPQRRLLVAEQSPCRGYKSTVEPTLHFGLGVFDAQRPAVVDTLLVHWPDGRTSRLTNVAVDQTVTVAQRNARVEAPPPLTAARPWLRELTQSNPINFVHRENDCVDFKEQVLLPHRYSQTGPGLAVGDVDGNGLDDVFAGAGEGVMGTLFRQVNPAPGQPATFVGAPLVSTADRKLSDDTGALLFDADGDGDLDLYVVGGGNEWPANHPNYQDYFYRNNGRVTAGAPQFIADPAALPDTRASGSCVVAADYDRDGDLDLFVGGRVLPRNYPLPARSYLLRNDGGKFTDVTPTALATVGMVTAALWSDYDQDGQVDLVVAGEFMPITFFQNQRGALRRVATPLPAGWWNSLAAGDFDDDGDVDYVAGNLGLNSRFKASLAEPVTVYAKDFDQNGTLDPILCAYNQGKCYPAAPRDQLADQVPAMKKRCPSYAAYGQMTVDQLLTPAELKGAFVATATELRSTYLENLGHGNFRPRPLPLMAQLAPLYGLLVEDLDQDGHLDLLAVGNDYGTDVQVGRYDALPGLVLRGNGRGEFVATPMSKSGFGADREARSLVQLATVNPGLPLYLVANNNDTLQTFQPTDLPNCTVYRPNPDDCAALLTLANGRTRRTELYYGAGYLSQSSRGLRLPPGTRVATVYTYAGRSRKLNLTAPPAPLARATTGH